MTLNTRLVSELIRQRAGYKDDSQAARIINLIPEALKEFGRLYAADPYTRPLVTTDKSTTTLTIGTNGQVNLVTGYDTYQFLLEYLDLGQMYWLPSTTATPFLLSAGTQAIGRWTFIVNPSEGETISVNGVTFTFRLPGPVVAGAGTSGVNGTYTRRGTTNGFPYYNLLTYPDSVTTRVVTRDGSTPVLENQWGIFDNSNNLEYLSDPDAGEFDFPWEPATYTNDPSDGCDGANPVPTVTERTFSSTEIEIGTTGALTAANFAAALNASADVLISVATYEAGATGTKPGVVTGTYDAAGTGGNAFTMANSSGGSVTRSGATFTGGAATAYALAINAFVNYFAELNRVRFTTTVTLPTGISLATDYYITQYIIDGNTAHFNLSSTADGLTPVVISSAGSGVLTVAKQTFDENPIQPIKSPQLMALPQYLSSVFLYYALQGSSLFLQAIDDIFPTGFIAFSVPAFPATLADLPDSKEAEVLFLSVLMLMVSPNIQGAR